MASGTGIIIDSEVSQTGQKPETSARNAALDDYRSTVYLPGI